MELTIKLDVDKNADWPMTYKIYKEGVLHINFSNGDYQKIDLEGVLLRPFIYINTSGFEGIEGPNVIDFGLVHINNTKKINVFLSNLSSVPANWKLSYLKSNKI